MQLHLPWAWEGQRMMEGGLVEIWEVGGRIVTMCCPAASHCVKACTVVVIWVLVVIVDPAVYWCAVAVVGVCGCSPASDSSCGERWITRSEQGLYRQQRTSKRLSSRRWRSKLRMAGKMSRTMAKLKTTTMAAYGKTKCKNNMRRDIELHVKITDTLPQLERVKLLF